MKKIIGSIFTPVYWLYYGVLLVLFHPIQVICRVLGGYPLRKKSVDFLNVLLIYGLWIMGAKIKYSGLEKIPKKGPFIIVSNHQNSFDISPIVWGFRPHHPKFVSKKELAKGIPSISYNLRHGGSALIDRNNRRQSITAILNLGKHIEEEKYCASIFPEGTRSKTGEINHFKEAGIEALLRTSPSSVIVPFVIDGHHQLMPSGFFPLTFGVTLNYSVLDPVDPKGKEPKVLANELETLVRDHLNS
ncbi:MAG: 1-acyl-sn-glycerol-3-phosphate acyltransferase [Reichenbachiella sp.]